MSMDYTNPSWLPGPGAYDTPEDEWRRFRSQQPDFWQRQAGLGDWDRRMRARYMLGAPEQAQASGIDPSYFDYLTQFKKPVLVDGVETGQSRGYMSYDALRAQAREAATAGITAPGAYLANEAGGGIRNQAEFDRRAWLSSQFGTGEGAAANQLAVANLLALQRGRGTTAGGPRGAYSGQMGQAIRRAMSTLYQEQLNVGQPKESFLDWYLSKTGQAAKTAGAVSVPEGGEL